MEEDRGSVEKQVSSAGLDLSFWATVATSKLYSTLQTPLSRLYLFILGEGANSQVAGGGETSDFSVYLFYTLCFSLGLF